MSETTGTKRTKEALEETVLTLRKMNLPILMYDHEYMSWVPMDSFKLQVKWMRYYEGPYWGYVEAPEEDLEGQWIITNKEAL